MCKVIGRIKNATLLINGMFLHLSQYFIFVNVNIDITKLNICDEFDLFCPQILHIL